MNVAIMDDFTKTENGMRDIPLLQPLAALLPKNRVGLVFPSPKTGDYLKRSETTKYWKQYCTACGLVEHDDNGNVLFPITPHCFRHSFATICFESGIDARTAADYLGDSVEVMEKVYIDLRRSHKDGATQQLNDCVQVREAESN